MNAISCAYCGTNFQDRLSACPSCGMAQAVPLRALPVGTKLQAGKFAVGRVLGEGGFGITYKGAHKPLQRTVALKELFPAGAVRTGTRVLAPAGRQDDFRQEQENILREARLIAGLNSPHIVDVHDMFQENGTAYIVMEHLEGQTLHAEIDGLGQLSPDRARQIALDTCEALTVLHGSRLLHRDIKPANIMLTADSRTVLIDFGSARKYGAHKTMQHTRILTEEYAAPEQYSGKARFGPYTDIYCLGATLFHALTGTPPARALERLQSTKPDVSFPPGLPKPICDAIRQALQLRIQDRPRDIETFRNALLGASASAVRAPRASKTRSDLKDAVAYINQGNTKAELNRHAEAIADYDQALQLDPDSALAYFSRGHSKTNLERHAEAIADYDQALRLDPDYALAYFNRGYSKAELNRHVEAIADYDQALRLDPDYALAFHNRGRAKAALHRHAEAIADYDQALRLDPDYALAYFNRGYSKGELNRHAEALADYDQALRLDPINSLAYNNRGVTKAELNRHAEALADYDQALRLKPSNVLAYHNRGNAKARLEHYAEAIADYDQVLRLDPGNTAAYHNRRDLERLLGR